MNNLINKCGAKLIEPNYFCRTISLVGLESFYFFNSSSWKKQNKTKKEKSVWLPLIERIIERLN